MRDEIGDEQGKYLDKRRACTGGAQQAPLCHAHALAVTTAGAVAGWLPSSAYWKPPLCSNSSMSRATMHESATMGSGSVAYCREREARKERGGAQGQGCGATAGARHAAQGGAAQVGAPAPAPEGRGLGSWLCLNRGREAGALVLGCAPAGAPRTCLSSWMHSGSAMAPSASAASCRTMGFSAGSSSTRLRSRGWRIGLGHVCLCVCVWWRLMCTWVWVVFGGGGRWGEGAWVLLASASGSVVHDLR